MECLGRLLRAIRLQKVDSAFCPRFTVEYRENTSKTRNDLFGVLRVSKQYVLISVAATEVQQ